MQFLDVTVSLPLSPLDSNVTKSSIITSGRSPLYHTSLGDITMNSSPLPRKLFPTDYLKILPHTDTDSTSYDLKISE